MNIFNQLTTITSSRKKMGIVIFVLLSLVSMYYLWTRMNLTKNNAELTTFFVLSIYPPPPEYKSIWTSDVITINFSDLLDTESVSYTITPNIRSRPLFEASAPSSFSILPIDPFQTNVQYTITLHKSIQSRSKVKLGSDYTFTMTRKEPSPDEVGYPSEIN